MTLFCVSSWLLDVHQHHQRTESIWKHGNRVSLTDACMNQRDQKRKEKEQEIMSKLNMRIENENKDYLLC